MKNEILDEIYTPLIKLEKKHTGCSSCNTGSCNKVNAFDWLSDIPQSDLNNNNDYVEVSFNNGVRKDFYHNISNLNLKNGDIVVVQGSTIGQDIGIVSLTKYLAIYQIRKKKIDLENTDIKKIYRISTEEDIKLFNSKDEKQKEVLIKSREIIRKLNLNMKLSFVELQADLKKGTFYFIADDRVDFRELIKELGYTLKMKIDMKQIGIRQESGIVGGVGSCGKVLCCSSWQKEFKSINTSAVRYQNLSINQAKLSGQCGRLKCCLNFELDEYVESVSLFPKNAEIIKTKQGIGKLVKKDIFKKTITYYFSDITSNKVLSIKEVIEIIENNKNGIFPELKNNNNTNGSDSKILLNKQINTFSNVESIKLKDLDKSSNKKNKFFNNKNKKSKITK